MVVIIRTNDDNYGTKDCFIANSIASAMEFIAKDAGCDEDAGYELDDFEVPQEEVMSSNCRVWDFEDGVVYRVHMSPKEV